MTNSTKTRERQNEMKESEYTAYKAQKRQELEAILNYKAMKQRLLEDRKDRESTDETGEWLPPIHITVWQAGMLLGLSDDDIRYYMQQHETDHKSGLDIGLIKTGKTGRHTYYIDEKKLCRELEVNRVELRKLIQTYCKPEYRRYPRNVSIFSFLRIPAVHGLPLHTITHDITTGRAGAYTYIPHEPLVDRTGRIVTAIMLPYRIAEGLEMSYIEILKQIKNK